MAEYFHNGINLQLPVSALPGVLKCVQVLPLTDGVRGKGSCVYGVYGTAVVADDWKCEHVYTICHLCWERWANMFLIRTFTHGTAYAYFTIGCRCGRCKNWSCPRPR